MKDSNSTNSQVSAHSAAPQDMGFSPWQRLKSKRISYLTLPLLLMATVTEFVILATGWKYQQVVCLPQGMGVTFFGIGPIGATILAVELLKLPLAIWTASRVGWQKGFMLMVGLPLICVLTFQLVKDMAVYEMGVALTPASEMLEKAATEEGKIAQLRGELAAIDQKKMNREQKLAELAAKKEKAKAGLEESLKRNGESRQDAISLTEYQKKELSEVEARQAIIIKQFDADTEKLTKSIADLRARREIEVGRATQWNAEEARIDNAYKVKLAEYTNKKSAYDKTLAEYNGASALRRALMKAPVDPGVAPARESNTILKPVEIAEIDAQIKAKESELLVVNTKRRDRVAQVDDDAHKLRADFDRRSSTKREETDHKREELLAANTALETQLAAEEKLVDQEFKSAAEKVDGIRAELDASRKKADGFYEAREASIKNTQVHRIATTVEIVRGLFMGQRPVSIKATAKERGDLYTDQISMVRIWVYPLLAFIVAFLPTLMVEIGFTTLFKPEQARPAHRLGFFGRRLHWLYTRAGRQKILRVERMAREASAEIVTRDRALAAANEAAAKAQAEKAAARQAAQDEIAAAALAHEKQLQDKEQEWVTKFAGMAESLNHTVTEKDALRDFQKSEIERQVQLRQNAWSDRLTQLQRELDEQRAAAETERTSLIQEHHKKMMEVSEAAKTQVIHARRQMADAELVAEEKTAKLTHELKQALNTRDTAESQLQLQTETLSYKLSQAREDTARELEKAARQEKHRSELQQLEFAKTLGQRDENFEHQLKQQEQELAVALEARLADEKNKLEQLSRRREAELERQLETRVSEVAARWNQELQEREDAAQVRLKQLEQQLKAQAEVRINDRQNQAEQELRRQKVEFERRLDSQSREAEARLREELQQKELAFHTQLKQREQEFFTKLAAREIELQNQLAADLHAREEEWQREFESRIRLAETRLSHEAKQKEEVFQIKLRQREQQLQVQFDARQAELQAQGEKALRAHEQEWERNAEARARATESRWLAEVQQKEEFFQSKARQRDEQWQAKLDAVRGEVKAQTDQELRRRELETAEAGLRNLRELEAKLRQEMQHQEEAVQAKARQREQDLAAQLKTQADTHQAEQAQWEIKAAEKTRTAVDHIKALLARAEKERDDAKEFAADGFRQVLNLEKKLTEASAFLNGLKNGNGKHLIVARS